MPHSAKSVNESKISKDGKTKVAEVNRNILGILLSYTLKTNKAVDFEKALQYPLSPIPLSISHPDGNRRTTAKSNLKVFILKGVQMQDVNAEGTSTKDAIVVAMIDMINTFTAIRVFSQQVRQRSS